MKLLTPNQLQPCVLTIEYGELSSLAHLLATKHRWHAACIYVYTNPTAPMCAYIAHMWLCMFKTPTCPMLDAMSAPQAYIQNPIV